MQLSSRIRPFTQLLRVARQRIGQWASWIAGREPLFVLLLAPWLIFPDVFRPLTLLALLMLPLLWLVRSLAGRQLSVRTPLNGPLLLLLVSLGPAVLVSPLPQLTTSHATTLLLGVAVCLAIVNGDPRWRRPEIGGGVLTMAGVGLALLALVGTEWEPSRIAILGRVTERLSLLVSNFSNLRAGGGFHPNEIGGALALLLPPVVSFTVVARRRGRQPLMDRWQMLAWLGGAVALLMVGILLLTQSRTAIMMMVLIGAVVVGMRRRGVGIIVMAVVIVVALLLVIGLLSGGLTEWLVKVDALSSLADTRPISWSSRIEIWRNALYLIRDYPIVGSGLNAYVPVAQLNYSFDVVSPDYPLTHAHNLWLQAGTDFGVTGLVAFSWMTVVLLLLGWAVQRRRQSDERTLLGGIWLGLLAWLGFGIMHAIPLGSRLSLLVWIMMGYLVATWQGDLVPLSPVKGVVRKRIRWATLPLVAVLVASLGVVVRASPFWSLNRGANLLDEVALSDTLSSQGVERGQQLSQAAALIESSTDLPGSFRRRALIHYESGERIQAVLLFRQDEGAEEYLVSRIRLLVSEGALTEALDMVQLGLETVPGSGRLTCLAADIHRLDGRWNDALAYYRQVPERETSFEGDSLRLAECYYQLGLFEGELRQWEAAAEWFGEAAGLNPTLPSYQIEYGMALFRATGELNQAVAIEESVLESNPDAVEAMLILADIYLQAERPQKSLEWSEIAVAAGPSDPQTWLRLAQAYWALEQSADAQSALAEGLRLDPENSVALTLQAEWESQ